MLIVVLSASNRPQDVAQAFALGANSFLVKPAAIGDLIKMLRCLHDWLHYNQFSPLLDRG